MLGGGCQDMLRWSGQNANQKVGPDKMPTTEKSHGQNANLGWHFVRLAFCPTTHNFPFLPVFVLTHTGGVVVPNLTKLVWEVQ